MRFHIINLGCKVNRVESDSFKAAFERAGAVEDTHDPEVVVINTCTVTGEAEKKTRNRVRGALKHYPLAAVVVTGCAVAINPDEFTAMSDRVHICDKFEVIPYCFGVLGLSDVDASALSFTPRTGEEFPTRVGVKIQDGCNNACTFCIVHVARGRAHSRSLKDCLAEVRMLADAGVHEIVLTGINLGSYEYEGHDLCALIRAMRDAAPEMRIRISSIEPETITDELIELLATSDGWVCRHLHVPLQAGSSKVLKDMNRHYDAERFLSRMRDLRERVPEISLSTDIIVGFPGESDEDFHETLRVAREVGFAKIHAFRYSDREGTPASMRTDKIDPEVIAVRAHTLAELGRELRQAEAKKRIGTIERIIVEAKEGAMSESYFNVIPPAHAPARSMMMVRLTDFQSGVFSCEEY